jgi:hypothetical protein
VNAEEVALYKAEVCHHLSDHIRGVTLHELSVEPHINTGGGGEGGGVREAVALGAPTGARTGHTP